MGIIKTLRLILRPLSLKDTLTIFELSQEEDLKKWIPDQVYKNEEEAKEVLDFLISQYTHEANPKNNPIVLAIELEGIVIGHVGLSPYEETCEIGYAIGEEHVGKGYATEAVLAYSKWGFNKFSLGSISAIVVKNNQGSVRVLEKAGYVLKEEAERLYHGKKQLCRHYIFNN